MDLCACVRVCVCAFAELSKSVTLSCPAFPTAPYFTVYTAPSTVHDHHFVGGVPNNKSTSIFLFSLFVLVEGKDPRKSWVNLYKNMTGIRYEGSNFFKSLYFDLSTCV